MGSKEHQLRHALSRAAAQKQGCVPSLNVAQILDVVNWLEENLPAADLTAPGCPMVKPSRLDVAAVTPRTVIYSFLTDYDLTFNDLFHTALDAAARAESRESHGRSTGFARLYKTHFSTAALAQWRENTDAFRTWLLAACKQAAVMCCYGPDRQMAPHEHAVIRELHTLIQRDQGAAYRAFGTAAGTYMDKDQPTIDAMSALWNKTEVFAGHVVDALMKVWDVAHETKAGEGETDSESDEWFEHSENSCEACEAGGVCSQYKHTCVWDKD